MADRKQGAGLSSGSSASVHKVNSLVIDLLTVTWHNHKIILHLD